MSPYLRLTTWLAAGALLTTGCAAISFGAQDDPTPYGTGDGGWNADGGNYVIDASTDASPSLPTGLSPLCASTSATCRPDDQKWTTIAAGCGIAVNPNADGGDAGDGGASDRLACRVVYDEPNNRADPKCVVGGDAKDGDPCTQGSDCKVGYECVGMPGRCRHYCCTPSVCDTMTQSNTGKTYFCDVQSEAASPQVKVPVCVVAQACELLKDKCGAGSTCALVDANLGTTSCVAIGPAQVGEDCEKTHCAQNLNCLGAPGARVCEKLCDLTHPCGSTQQCVYKFPALKTQNAGICQ